MGHRFIVLPAPQSSQNREISPEVPSQTWTTSPFPAPANEQTHREIMDLLENRFLAPNFTKVTGKTRTNVVTFHTMDSRLNDVCCFLLQENNNT